MKTKKVTIIVMLSSLLFSCSQNETQPDSSSIKSNGYEFTIGEEQRNEVESENNSINDVLNFSYKGKIYSSKCSFGEELSIENKDIEVIFNKLSKTPNIAIAINPDHSIEFYDSMEELYNMNTAKDKPAATRASDYTPYIQNFEIRFYEHAKGRTKGGRYIHFYSNGTQGNKSPATLRIPQEDLQRRNFNDCISSIQMWGHLGNQLGSLQSGQYQTASVTFYDGNFTGRSLTFNDITINKTYSERDYFSSFDFNDLTSSIEVIYY